MCLPPPPTKFTLPAHQEGKTILDPPSNNVYLPCDVFSYNQYEKSTSHWFHRVGEHLWALPVYCILQCLCTAHSILQWGSWTGTGVETNFKTLHTLICMGAVKGMISFEISSNSTRNMAEKQRGRERKESERQINLPSLLLSEKFPNVIWLMTIKVMGTTLLGYLSNLW